MTLTKTHSRPTDPVSDHETKTGAETAADAVGEPGPRVWKDMTVEVALCVMSSARVGHLLVCDDDGRRTGLVTRARLTAVRDSAGYTDRVRLRDVTDSCGQGH
ncbi:CBS domain-containing protein [Streptomyces flavofungini]|uniref:CBS domain-containing protein n=1 Tax=Streptomyces flavofungini TaxID=68200 RepID=UPI0034DE3A96